MNETQLVKLQPYRYLVIQKNELEKLVAKMLEAEIIRDNTNSFASHVILVKKKDGSWCLCVDY